MGVVAERWLGRYRNDFPVYTDAALRVKAQVEELLGGRAINVHLIEARAKSPDSVAEKIERHSYGRPSAQFDDLIGIRIITLFDHSVPDVARHIRSRFNVEEDRSSDKASGLNLRQVGYRSQHLVVKTRNPGLEPVGSILESTYIEIQIRSVIAHSWAEIEHSLRYKIGDGIPLDLARRFDALAGTLELVDREFSSIEKETINLVKEKAIRYSGQFDLFEHLSTVQLLGALKSARPEMKALGPDGLVLNIEDAFRFAKILVRCGIADVSALLHELSSNNVSTAIDSYSGSISGSVDASETSGIAVLGIIIGLRSPEEFRKVQAFSDPKLQLSVGLD